MPTVRKYQQTTTLDPIPGVRRTAADTPESLGAGLHQERAQTAQAAARLAGQGAAIAIGIENQHVQEERDRADRLALTDAENRLGRWELDTLHDPARGALTLKGKNALGAPEAVSNDFNRVADEIETGLNPRQREAFMRLRAQRGLSVDLTLRRHVMGEIQRYEGEELEATVANGTSLAIANALDPRRVGDELGRVVSALRDHLPNMGIGPEGVQRAIGEATSSVHVGVIGRLLELDYTAAAQAWFDETRDQISGPAIAKIEAALEAGTLTATAQKTADQIALSGMTFSQQLDMVRSIEDPKLRDQVRQRVEHDRSIRQAIERDVHESALTGVYDYIEGKGASLDGMQRLPVWGAMSGGERSAAQRYLENRIEGVVAKPGGSRYFALRDLADDDPTAFAQMPLVKERGKMSTGELEALRDMQSRFRSDAKKPQPEAETFSNNSLVRNVFNDTYARLTGRDPDRAPTEAVRKDDPAVEARASQLRYQVEQRTALLPKSATQADVQAIVDDVLMRTGDAVVDEWGPWNSIVKKNVASMRYSDIPPDKIAAAKKALGDNATAVDITTWYVRFLATGGR